MITAQEARKQVEEKKTQFKLDVFNGVVLAGYKNLIEGEIKKAISMGQNQCEVVFPKSLTELEMEAIRNLILNFGYTHNGFDHAEGSYAFGLVRFPKTKLSVMF